MLEAREDESAAFSARQKVANARASASACFIRQTRQVSSRGATKWAQFLFMSKSSRRAAHKAEHINMGEGNWR
jgi:hypothetical protein